MTWSTFMTRVFTDQGIVGEYALGSDISSAAELLLGQNALERGHYFSEQSRYPNNVAGAVDLVLWDIAGKISRCFRI